jgi:hypothetical protein
LKGKNALAYLDQCELQKKRKFYNIDTLVSEENENIIEIDSAKQVGPKDIG